MRVNPNESHTAFVYKHTKKRVSRQQGSMKRDTNWQHWRISNQGLNEMRAGYVYLLKPVGHNVYKIGCTTEPERRFKTLSNKYPFEFECVGKQYYTDYNYAERYWHRFFKHRRLLGEWFLLSKNDIETFLRVAS